MKKIILAAMIVATMLLPYAVGASIEYKATIGQRYEQASIFSQGLAAVKLNGKWGYINEKGKSVIEPIYDYASLFSEGKALVGRIDSQEDLLDELGIKHTVYNMALSLADREGNVRPIMVNGTPFICKGFNTDEQYTMYGGVIQVTQSGNPLYFFSNGTLMPHTPKYTPTEGTMIFWNEANKEPISVTDMNGNQLFTLPRTPDMNGNCVTKMYPFNQGVALADVARYNEQGTLVQYGFGFINKQGDFITPATYRDFYRNGTHDFRVFNDGGIASIMQDGKFGGINSENQVVIPFEYDKLFTFQEGLAPFSKGDLWGVIDIYGTVIVQPIYKAISRYNNGVALAFDGTGYFFIDKVGNPTEVSDQIDLHAYIQTEKNPDGTVSINSQAPDSLMITKGSGGYGYMRVTYNTDPPAQGEMTAWAYKDVVQAVNTGLVPISMQNMYKEKISREDFAHLMISLLEKQTKKSVEEIVLDKTGKTLDTFTSSYPFIDCFDKNVIAANALGLMNGDGKWANGAQGLTREDAATMMSRVAKWVSPTISGEKSTAPADMDTVSGYAKDSVQLMKDMGIMNGDGSGRFEPKGSYTRQEAYITAFRLFTALNKK